MLQLLILVILFVCNISHCDEGANMGAKTEGVIQKLQPVWANCDDLSYLKSGCAMEKEVNLARKKILGRNVSQSFQEPCEPEKEDRLCSAKWASAGYICPLGIDSNDSLSQKDIIRVTKAEECEDGCLDLLEKRAKWSHIVSPFTTTLQSVAITTIALMSLSQTTQAYSRQIGQRRLLSMFESGI